MSSGTIDLAMCGECPTKWTNGACVLQFPPTSEWLIYLYLYMLVYTVITIFLYCNKKMMFTIFSPAVQLQTESTQRICQFAFGVVGSFAVGLLWLSGVGAMVGAVTTATGGPTGGPAAGRFSLSWRRLGLGSVVPTSGARLGKDVVKASSADRSLVAMMSVGIMP